MNTLAGVISTVVPDSPHKIFIGGLPNYLNEDQVNYSQALQEGLQVVVAAVISHCDCCYLGQ